MEFDFNQLKKRNCEKSCAQENTTNVFGYVWNLSDINLRVKEV